VELLERRQLHMHQSANKRKEGTADQKSDKRQEGGGGDRNRSRENLRAAILAEKTSPSARTKKKREGLGGKREKEKLKHSQEKDVLSPTVLRDLFLPRGAKKGKGLSMAGFQEKEKGMSCFWGETRIRQRGKTYES